jgi:heptosyltransferase I
MTPAHDGGQGQSDNTQPSAVGPIGPASRFLIIRPSALGDVCRSVGLLASIRAAYPRATIDWLVQDSFVQAIDEHPAFASNADGSGGTGVAGEGGVAGRDDGHGGGKVIPFARHVMKRWYTPAGARAFASLVNRLRTGRYDIVLDAQGLLRSGLFGFLSGAKVRVGLAEAREGATSLYTHLVEFRSGQDASHLHTVARMHGLLAAIGVPNTGDLRLYASQQRQQQALANVGLRPEHGTPSPFILLAPSSRWPAKQWPADRYAIVARALHHKHRCPIVCVGSQAERAACEGLFATAPDGSWLIDAFGKTSIADLMGLAAQAKLVIGSDSSAVHMAVGFGTPCVALYGPTDIRKVGPAIWRGSQGRVITLQHIEPHDKLDHKSLEPGRTMMARITPDEVIQASNRLLT